MAHPARVGTRRVTAAVQKDLPKPRYLLEEHHEQLRRLDEFRDARARARHGRRAGKTMGTRVIDETVRHPLPCDILGPRLCRHWLRIRIAACQPDAGQVWPPIGRPRHGQFGDPLPAQDFGVRLGRVVAFDVQIPRQQQDVEHEALRLRERQLSAAVWEELAAWHVDRQDVDAVRQTRELVPARCGAPSPLVDHASRITQTNGRIRNGPPDGMKNRARDGARGVLCRCVAEDNNAPKNTCRDSFDPPTAYCASLSTRKADHRLCIVVMPRGNLAERARDKVGAVTPKSGKFAPASPATVDTLVADAFHTPETAASLRDCI